MYKVLNGDIVNKNLPKSGIINGATVMNYHKLPQKTLIAEGWLPLEEERPEYDETTEQLVWVEDRVEKDKVVRVYEKQTLPEREPDPPSIDEELEKLKERVDELEKQFEEVKRS